MPSSLCPAPPPRPRASSAPSSRLVDQFRAPKLTDSTGLRRPGVEVGMILMNPQEGLARQLWRVVVIVDGPDGHATSSG